MKEYWSASGNNVQIDWGDLHESILITACASRYKPFHTDCIVLGGNLKDRRCATHFITDNQ